MEWLFVHSKDGGWWLKIDNPEQLMEYYGIQNGSQYLGAFKLYMDYQCTRPEKIIESLSFEERVKMTNNPDFKKLQCAILYAEKYNTNVLDGFRLLNIERGRKELSNIFEYGQVYINRVGGSTFFLNYDQFCRRKEMIFPDFKEEDIRIKQFKGGTHYYAYIGDMQVRNGDEMKWNSRDEAYQSAVKLISNA